MPARRPRRGSRLAIGVVMAVLAFADRLITARPPLPGLVHRRPVRSADERFRVEGVNDR